VTTRNSLTTGQGEVNNTMQKKMNNRTKEKETIVKEELSKNKG
jgi:hypothetical protein